MISDDEEIWSLLFAGPGPADRLLWLWSEGLAQNPAAPVDLLLRLLDHDNGVLYRTDLPAAVLEAAVDHPDQRVRRTLAERRRGLSREHWLRLLAREPNLPRRAVLANDVAEGLTDDDLAQLGVVRELSADDLLTEEQHLAELGDGAGFDPRQSSHTLSWVAAQHADSDAMRRLAAAEHPLVRRSVARARRLPPDVVAALARDEDRVVRLFLAESCDDAPADMLLEVATWWTGSFSHWDRPRTHPNFPRTGLLRFAKDPNWRLRRLALDDPESTPEHVEAFVYDLEVAVRVRAAEDSRLSAGSAAWLLGDEERWVRGMASRHAVLPAEMVVFLLLDARTAGAAIQNPTIPVPVMHRMLDLLDRLNQATD